MHPPGRHVVGRRLDRQTSVLMLEAQTPEQVCVGQPYTYTLRLTNLTDASLHRGGVRGAAGESDVTSVGRRGAGGGGDRRSP